MLLNPKKMKALVIIRSRTVNPPYGDFVLSGVSICASPNLDIIGLKFDRKLTIEDHVRGIVSRVAKNGYFEAGEACLCGHFCVTSLLLCICYPSVVLRCGDLLLNVIFSFSSVGCIR